MGRSRKSALLALALLVSCSPAWAWTALLGPSARVTVDGFSVLLPQGPVWGTMDLDPRATSDVSVTYNARPTDEPLQSEFAAVTALMLPGDLVKRPDLMELLAAGQKQETESPRFQVLQFDSSQLTHQGARCVRSYFRAVDKGPQGQTPEALHMETLQVICLHPTASGLGVSVVYSRRAPARLKLPALGKEAQALLDSLLFHEPKFAYETVDVAGTPKDIVASDGSIWVAVSQPHRVVRIDPQTAAIQASIPLSGPPSGLAAFAKGIWVGLRSNAVARIDPATNKIDATFPLSASPDSLVAGAGSLWIATSRPGTVVNLNPDGSKGHGSIPLNAEAGSAVEFNGLVYASAWPQHLHKFRPDNARTVATVEVKDPGGVFSAPQVGGAGDIFAGYGSIWVAGRMIGAVLRVDPEKMERIAWVPVGRRPGQMVAWNGMLAVASFGENRVTLVNPATNKPVGEPVYVGRGPVGLAVHETDLWVTHLRSGIVIRVRPK